jgi:hypothetical protein
VKRILIFEGIASSGKTTTARQLVECFPEAAIVSEDETLMPLIANLDPGVAREHLTAILAHVYRLRQPVVVVDRFHLTHAFRTSTPLRAFRTLEARLSRDFNPIVILLTVRNDAIPARLLRTSAKRGDGWQRGRRGSFAERVAYYRSQQVALLQLAQQSRLPVLIIDTTEMDWPRYVQVIIRAVAGLDLAGNDGQSRECGAES